MSLSDNSYLGFERGFQLPPDFHLDVRLNANGKPYTTMMHFEGVSANKVGEALIELFSQRYGIDPMALQVISSYEPDGKLLVGVVSRVPVPAKQLTSPREDHHYRIENHPKLLDRGGSDSVIDV